LSGGRKLSQRPPIAKGGAGPELLGMEVQIFGVQKNADTRKALRFFAERRIRTHFVDLTVRAASPGELRRFAERFGVQALLDRESRRFADLGLRATQLSDARWLQRLAEEPLLLRMPLVRWQQRLTVGSAEDEWRAWLAADRSTAQGDSE
jgi:arsenate reductase-like glutaredoxin family protein